MTVQRDIPIVVRIAGMAAEQLDCYQQSLWNIFNDHVNFASNLGNLYDRAQASLHKVVPEHPAAMRRFLLSIRRDCYNRRKISKYKKKNINKWEKMSAELRSVLEKVIEMEDGEEESYEAFEIRYYDVLSRERRSYLDLYGDLSFRRGLTLASTSLVRAIEKLKKYSLPPRKERKVYESIARYISRTIVKSSPFSTLTKVGMCTIEDNSNSCTGKDCISINGDPGRWTEKSLFRVSHYLLDQCRDLLTRNEHVRDRLRVSINSTLEKVDTSSYRLLRPLCLGKDSAAKNRLRYFPPAQVKLRLSGPLVDWLVENLSRSSMLHRDLVERALEGVCGISTTIEDAQRARHSIELTIMQLAEAGFLMYAYPWPTYEVYPERALAAFLEDVDGDERLDSLRESLGTLLRLEEEYSISQRPLDVLSKMNEVLSNIMFAARLAAGKDMEFDFEIGDNKYYEDVLVCGDNEKASHRAIADADKESMKSLYQIGKLMWSLGAVFDPRFDFLVSLRALIAREWPGRCRIPLLEVFAASKSLLEDFLSFLAGNFGREFNPMSVECEHLKQTRSVIANAMNKAFTECVEGEFGRELSLETLRELVELLPPRFKPAVGPCMFVQPVDPGGRFWVLNRMFEGTGRLSSRFTAIMPDTVREDFCTLFQERARIGRGERTWELLDLLYTRRSIVNLHWPLTNRIFEAPGEQSFLTRSARLSYRDLFVEVDDSDSELIVVDRNGQALLPVQLSSLHNAYLPEYMKFLKYFGPGVQSSISMQENYDCSDSMRTMDRVCIENLVVKRKKWIIDVESVPEINEDAQGYAAINKWRLDRGLPDKVFLIESIDHDFDVEIRKPQFIDFRSPTFMSIFCSYVKGEKKEICLEEALPVPEHFPLDCQGKGWNLELMLEGILLDNCSEDI